MHRNIASSAEETNGGGRKRLGVWVVWTAAVVRLLWEAVQESWRGRLDWYFAILLIIVDVRRIWESAGTQNKQAASPLRKPLSAAKAR